MRHWQVRIDFGKRSCSKRRDSLSYKEWAADRKKSGRLDTAGFSCAAAKETQPPEELLKSIDAEFLYVGTNGVKYLVEVAESEIVEKLTPDFEAMKRIDAQGVIVTAKANEPGIDFVSRYFAPVVGINEDPVTGSAHCCLGPYWSAKLGKTNIAAKQLSLRRGFLKLNVTEQRVLMSGQAVTTLSGTLCTEK